VSRPKIGLQKKKDKMMEKCKPSFGQWRNKRLFLTDEEKLILIKDYLAGKESKASVYFRYTGYPEDHGKIAVWMKKLGIKKIEDVRDVSFVPMSKAKKPIQSEVDFEKLQLEKRVAELEKQLKLAEMKAVAFSTMVDIAEREFNIPIRKKFNTKP
jgi:transposase